MKLFPHSHAAFVLSSRPLDAILAPNGFPALSAGWPTCSAPQPGRVSDMREAALLILVATLTWAAAIGLVILLLHLT